MTESKYYYKEDLHTLALKIQDGTGWNTRDYLNLWHQGKGELTHEITGYREADAIISIPLWEFCDAGERRLNSIKQIIAQLQDTLEHLTQTHTY